jgi:viroplasmin and RNaseH domain-containing protein
LDGVANESITEGKNESINESKESDILAKIEKLRVDAEAGKIKTLDQFLDKFKPLQKQLKALGESVNEVSYNVKADNAYQFINGATAVLGMYLKDEKLESGVKNTLQRVVKDLEGLRKYFFNRKDESINKSLRLTKIK